MDQTNEHFGSSPVSVVSPTGKMQLYNPKEYAFIGFLFSLLPVFFMSYSNAKVLPNGEEIKKKMKTYFWVYVGFFLLYVLILCWAAIVVTKALYAAMESNPDALLMVVKGAGYEQVLDKLALKTYVFFAKLLDNSGYIFGLINLILLIIVVKFTNKSELPIYTQLKDKNEVVTRRYFVPVLIGVAFPLAVYLGFPVVLQVIAKWFI